MFIHISSVDYYYNFSNTVCFKMFMSSTHSLLAFSTYSLIFFCVSSTNFIPVGNNWKLKASIEPGHLPCLEKLLKEIEECVLGKQCLYTCVEGISLTEVQKKPQRLNIHILTIYVWRVMCGGKYGRRKTVLVRKKFQPENNARIILLVLLVIVVVTIMATNIVCV